MRILIGSPIHQKPETLVLFLQALERLDAPDVLPDYLFVDDNDNPISSQWLVDFANRLPGRVLPLLKGLQQVENRSDEHTHYWPPALVWKVAGFKNRLIDYALQHHYDALFLVDSDLVLHSRTLCRLVETEKDIVSEIFWTRWQPNGTLLPQVWLSDEYNLFHREEGEVLSAEEQAHRELHFIHQLHVPGLYEVGGLGACTLIRRRALVAGVHFGKIKNVSFWGEDRHFCIRAAAYGFPLFVDTYYPAMHLYREADRIKAEQLLSTLNYFTSSASTDHPYYLNHAEHPDTPDYSLSYNRSTPSSAPKFSEPPVIPDHLRESAVFAKYTADSFAVPQAFSGPRQSELHTPAASKPKLTLSMTVYNEADCKLADVLRSHREYIDEAVIIDDGSHDGSGELCRELLKGIPLRLVRNETASFTNEVELRKQQWRETVASSPEWILNMDADEMFESRFAQGVHSLLAGTKADTICFRLYDMWSSTHYRDDDYWQAHRYYRPFLIRYKEEFSYKWKEQALHCGRFPDNVLDLPSEISNYRIQHWGWYTPAIRAAKFERYQLLDPNARYGWKEQYESILDANPRLTLWVDQDNKIVGDEPASEQEDIEHEIITEVAKVASVEAVTDPEPEIKDEIKDVFYGKGKGAELGMKCKLCGSSDTGVFHRYERFTLMGCGSCGLVFRNDVDRIQPEELIAEIYNVNWVAMRDSAAASTYGDHALFGLMLLEMFSPGKGRLLEIGSGTGEFIHAALQSGWNAVGIEPSIDSRAYAKDKYDVDLIPGYWNGEIEEDAQTQEINEAQNNEEDTDLSLSHQYEAVACWHVLEHIADPIAFLTDLREQLQPDGTLYMTVPNKNSFTNEAYGACSPLFTEEDHLYHYSEHTLTLLLAKSGLRPIAMFTRQLSSGLDDLLQAHPLYGELDLTERMGLLAKLQGEKRGHELCCVAKAI
ncbi:methyltransferase domain-containing protein [Paenibacillus brasilensis]|uniref:2-polyprenyl-3-methyl-5-hydroxy-6-metoxy-1, 4-benzoquinol methylase n=1 Tax=Paenibacillus brasilensis TaxID=128574 RepID=A0ABU0KYB9_9BACL|nr:methyltransferase domain-containing protein [Paenibacillus brasilensis]MDQ0493570.1 2-polyprenyl-3-methyl-5-hydroxy-6-metoxy-1,4-benzoquinol methylase [Paenibacillus brasilensis]